MSFTKEEITGTLVNYFATCKREAWLYAHHIHADQNDENVLMGKAISELKDTKLQDFPYSNLKFDKLSKERGHYVVTEYKKSFKNPKSAKMQLLFYMYILRNSLGLKIVKGKVISGKKVLAIDGNEENFSKIVHYLEDIQILANEPKPPIFEYKKICDNCAYRNYCM